MKGGGGGRIQPERAASKEGGGGKMAPDKTAFNGGGGGKIVPCVEPVNFSVFKVIISFFKL